MAKICFVDYDMSLTGGVEQVTVNLASEFSAKHDVSITSIFFTGGSPAYELPGITFTYLRQDYHYKPSELLGMAKVLYRHIKENSYDIVFLQGDVAGFLGGLIKKFHRKLPYFIFCTHGALVNQWDELSVRTFRKTASGHCEKTVTLTERDRSDYIRMLGMPEDRVCFIYNWIDDSARHSDKYSTDSKRIISAGRLEKEKCFDRLIDSFAAIVQKHGDWALDIYGNGTEYDNLDRQIKENGLSENVFLKGENRNLIELYKDYSFYVMSSKREGLPLVLLEAQANRLPVVSFDIVSGPNEIISDNINGLLVKPGDTRALSEAMCRLIENPDLRISMSRSTPAVFNKFGKDGIMRQWDELTGSVLQSISF